mgnify:CR=1 FL=1
MNEAEKQQIAQMVQGGQMQGQPPAQGQGQPPMQEQPQEAPPTEVYIQLQEMLKSWKPQTSEGRQYYEQVQALLDNLGGI